MKGMRSATVGVALLVISALIVPGSQALGQAGGPAWLPAASGEAQGPVRLAVTAVSESGLEISVTVPGVVTSPVEAPDGTEYVQLRIPGCGATAEQVGLPEMPFKGFFLEIPYGLEVSVDLADQTATSLGTGFTVYPFQPPLPDGGEGEDPPFQIDESAYASSGPFPATPVVVSDPGFMRGRRVVFVQVFPLQYNPQTTELRAFASLQLTVSFAGAADAAGAARKQRLATPESEALAQALILNYEPIAPQLSAAQPDLSTGPAADYLIIVADVLYEEILPLATWKHMKGFMTRVAKMSEVGTTASDVKSYIQDAYDNWTPAPSYVLLVGDSGDVPPDYYSGSYSCTSDHPYACVDGSDYYPDLTLGRLPVHTETECTNVVNKILKYDRTPDLGNWYDDFLAAGYFQDSNDDNGVADRWFMETTMTVYDFLVNEQGWSGHTALCTSYWPLHYSTWHFRSSSYPHRADLNQIRWGVSPYPDPVPTWIVNLWTSASQSTTDVTTAINTGVGLVQHRDHGGETSWGDPPYSTSNINSLANGVKTPVVFSTNCLTGSFQRSGGDCFCEAFIKKSPGGCVGIKGATRTSYSGYNDLLVHGIYTCFYPTAYDTSHSGNIYPASWRPAEAMNFGKYYMYTYEGATSCTAGEFHMFHWFGDPELTLRTGTPQALVVNHPPTATYGSPVNITVTVQMGGSPLPGALVCISHATNNAHWTEFTDVTGSATFSGINFPQTGTYDVVVTAQNAVPYEGTIVVGGGGPSGDIHVTDSIPPPTDLQMPFGNVMVGQCRTEQITVTNVDATNNLTVTNIYIGGGAYAENFNDGQAQGWDEDVDVDWQVISNEYRAYQAAPTASNTMVATYGGQTFDDFSYEVRMRRAEAEGAARYLIFRASADFERSPTSTGSAYAFGIDETKYFIYKQVSGTMTTLVSWTSSAYINDPTTWNTLKVVADGSNLEFYINGNLVHSLTDSSLTNGRIGLVGYTSTSYPSVTHYFDDVLVDVPAVDAGVISAEQRWYNDHACEGGTPEDAPEGCVPPAYSGPTDTAEPVAQVEAQADTDPFSLQGVPPLPQTLGPGASFTFDVVFCPPALGLHTATLVIESDDVDEPRVNVELSGTGVDCELPPEPVNPDPPNGATDVPLDTDLSWDVSDSPSEAAQGSTVSADRGRILAAVGPMNGRAAHRDEDTASSESSPDAQPVVTPTPTEYVSGGVSDAGTLGASGTLETPGSLTTLFATNNGQDGNMFDLTAKETLTITSWDGNLRGDPTTIEVYYVTDHTSYVGKETNSALWTLLGSETLASTNPPNTPTPVSIGGLTIEAGETVGIYWTTTGSGLEYTDGPLGVFENAELRFEDRGTGNAYPFGSVFSPRVWNGTIYYDYGGTTYDVYLGISPAAMALICADLPGPPCTPPATLNASTTYYWKVVAKNDCGSVESDTWHFTTCALPAAPVNPDPPNGATDVPCDTDLSWGVAEDLTPTPAGDAAEVAAGVPAAGSITARSGILDGPIDGVATAGEPASAARQKPAYVVPGPYETTDTTTIELINPAATYIAGSAPGNARGLFFVSDNDLELTSVGFFVATPSGESLTVNLYATVAPSTRGALLATNTVTTAGSGEIWHDVPLSYTLQAGVEYDLEFAQPVNFTTWPYLDDTVDAPFTVSGVTALDGESGGDASNWAMGQFRLEMESVPTTTYDVYLGTSPAGMALICADLPGPPCVPPALLDPNTTYFWKVVAKNDCGSVESDIWEFTTCPLPAVPINPDPPNGATEVSIYTDLSWGLSEGLPSCAGGGAGGVPADIRAALNSIIARSGILDGPVVVSSPGADDAASAAAAVTYTRPEEIANVVTAAELGIDTDAELDVVVCGANYADTLADVQAKLVGTGKFNTVSTIDAYAVTPTLAELQAFDAVQVHRNRDYADPTALGNVMADYVDAGGGVVCMVFEIGSYNEKMGGRWETGGYVLMERHGNISGQATLGTVHIPSHAIMAGVSTFDGGSYSYRPDTTTVYPGVTRIADWSDGRPLVCERMVGGVPRVDVTFYPKSSDLGSSYWQTSTDGALLMANALEYVGGGGSVTCTTTYDVYLGTSPSAMALICEDLPGPPCTPPTLLDPNTTYFWKVVAKNECGSVESDIWHFTTGPVGCQATLDIWASVRYHGGPVSAELGIELDASAIGMAVVSEPRRADADLKIVVEITATASFSVTGPIEAEDVFTLVTYEAIPTVIDNGGGSYTLELLWPGGLPDQACYNIDLTGKLSCTILGDADCMVKVLAGNTNGDDYTDLIDMAYAKSKNGSPVAGDDVRFDVNLDGHIDLIDMAMVKSLNGGYAICP